MPTLTIDALTASVASAELREEGSDLVAFAQALDEEWHRHAPDPTTGTRNLISTMGHRSDCPPTGLTYHHAQLIRPSATPAEERPIADRFLRARPRFAGELIRTGDGLRLEVAMLRVAQEAMAVLDHAGDRCSLFLPGRVPPATVMAAAVGRRLDAVADVGHLGSLVVTGMRQADEAEMRDVWIRPRDTGVVVETGMPARVDVDFEPIFRPMPTAR